MDLAAVYGRELDGRTLTLAPSGWTYRDTFVLYDVETGTLWYPFDDEGLTAVAGPLQDSHLPSLPSFDGLWADFLATHPGASYLE